MSANMDPEAPFLQVQVPFHQVLVSFHHIQGPSLAQVPFHAWRPEVVDQEGKRFSGTVLWNLPGSSGEQLHHYTFTTKLYEQRSPTERVLGRRTLQ
eukprot:Em0018g133a